MKGSHKSVVCEWCALWARDPLLCLQQMSDACQSLSAATQQGRWKSLKQRVALRSRISYKNILSVDFKFQKKSRKKTENKIKPQIGIVRARKLASFCLENAIAVVLLRSGFSRNVESNRNKKRNVRRFINLQSGEGLTSHNKKNYENLSGDKVNWSFPGCLFFENKCENNFKSNLLLIVMLVLVLESKGFFQDCRILFDHAHTFCLLPIALQTYIFGKWKKKKIRISSFNKFKRGDNISSSNWEIELSLLRRFSLSMMIYGI